MRKNRKKNIYFRKIKYILEKQVNEIIIFFIKKYLLEEV